MELVEGDLYETPDGRRYVAGYLPGKGWGLRPYPPTRAPAGSCTDFAGRVRAAAGLLAELLFLEPDTGRLLRLSVCPPPAGQRAPAQAEVNWAPTGWTLADLI